jgi:hypothetical protein
VHIQVREGPAPGCKARSQLPSSLTQQGEDILYLQRQNFVLFVRKQGHQNILYTGSNYCDNVIS